MKKLYSILMLLGISCFAVAQPSLTSTNVIPIVGKNYTIHITTPLANTQGTAGANQTWNFSSIASGSTSVVNAVAPSSTTYATSYASSNLCLKQGSNYFFYTNVSGSYSSTGFIQSTEHLIYTDLEKLLIFPFTYNNTFTDVLKGTSNVVGISSVKNGSVTVTADAYGSIITPAYAFPNALRVHVQENYTDTFNNQGVITVLTSLNNDYIWYVVGVHYPVFQISYHTTGTSTVNSGFYLDAGSIGVNEVLAETYHLNIFPNPTSENNHVSMELKESSYVRLLLKDLLGNTVEYLQDGKLEPGNHQFAIDVSRLGDGIYFLEAVVNEKQFGKRMLVSH